MRKSSVLSDTTPVYYLFRAGFLHILKELYGEILITPGVASELEQGGIDIREHSWIKVKKAPPVPDELLRINDLGRGESEVLAFAKTFKNPLVIIDDGLGRILAGELGLSLTGTGGVLIAAKRRKLISSVSDVLDKMVKEGFHLSGKHRKEIVKKAGE